MTHAARLASLLTLTALTVIAACGSGASQPPPAQPVAPPPAQSPSARAQALLAAHNQYRAQHCAPPLRWSERIAADAQRFADELAANGCAFRHSSSDYGENLMRFSPAGSHDAAYVVETWYREIANYDFNRPVFGMDTGHFTQVVWAGSTELGCGVALCDGGETWVCNYSEPGNMRGEFPQNVQPTSCR